MTEQIASSYEDGEINLLDILVTLAESWRLLVFAPLMAGVLAWGLSFLWPQSFESVAIVRLNEEEVALLHTAPVLDPLIQKFGLLPESDGIVDDARQGLKKSLTFTVDKKAKLVTITVKAHLPDVAQALGSSAIAELLKELQVKGKEKALIEKTIFINNRAIANAEDALEAIQGSLKRGRLTDQAQESAIKNFAAISADISRRSIENEELFSRLAPKGAELYVQEFGLSQRKVSPKRSLVVVLAILATAFALLIFVFARKAWTSAAKDAESAVKLASILSSFGLKKE